MTVYSYEEALSESQRYFDNDDLAAKVFVDKYALRNKEGEILEKTPEDMHWRIAGELARIEKKKFKSPLSKQEIFEYLDHFKRIVPQGSPMFGIGNPYQYVSLANCFLVESPEDSYGGILKTDEQLVQIAKRRGGAGMDISKLRPSETKTTNAAGSSTGIIPFMERYSNSIREVGQSGRRGALLISLNVHHPEILNFIRVKRDLTKITGANLSIKLTDEFLLAVEKDTTYQQRWPVDSDNPQISQDIKAKDVWDAIIDNVHLMSEPGLLFWDTVLKNTPSDCYKEYASKGTNPCQPKWAKVLTPLGIRTFGEVNIGDRIWSSEGWTTIINKQNSGIQQVYRYGTTAGCFYGTKTHKVLERGQEVQVQYADSLDILSAQDLHSNIVIDSQGGSSIIDFDAKKGLSIDTYGNVVFGVGNKRFQSKNNAVLKEMGRTTAAQLNTDVKINFYNRDGSVRESIEAKATDYASKNFKGDICLECALSSRMDLKSARCAEFIRRDLAIRLVGTELADEKIIDGKTVAEALGYTGSGSWRMGHNIQGDKVFKAEDTLPPEEKRVLFEVEKAVREKFNKLRAQNIPNEVIRKRLRNDDISLNLPPDLREKYRGKNLQKSKWNPSEKP